VSDAAVSDWPSLVSSLQAVLLGGVEAATEFLPVSSTGHLIVLVDLLGFSGPPGRVFEVAIQLGAILAVCVLYASRFTDVLLTLGREQRSRNFVAAILVGVLPAFVAGALLHDWIKAVLFSPLVVCISMVTGGVIMLLVDRGDRGVRFTAVEVMPLRTALAIGAMQCLALVPGVSRSGATILGALLLGADRRTAAEFSFFLAVPTMAGAVTWDLWHNRDTLALDGIVLIALGLVTAFLVSLLVVRWLIRFVSRHSFRPFAWYRIVVGSALLAVYTVL